MKSWAKGGLIGFVATFIGLWIILLIIGNDDAGWKCMSLGGPSYCTFTTFLSSYVHWAFVLFFSWVGFFGGVIDARLINKIVFHARDERIIPLKITSTILITAIIVFAIIGLLAFDNWVQIMFYSAIFAAFIILLSWAVGKWKYRV